MVDVGTLGGGWQEWEPWVVAGGRQGWEPLVVGEGVVVKEIFKSKY